MSVTVKLLIQAGSQIEAGSPIQAGVFRSLGLIEAGSLGVFIATQLNSTELKPKGPFIAT